MPRGRYWYGPGFWKRDTNWVPGSGGFRGGAYYRGGPGTFRPHGWGWGPCYWFHGGYAVFPPVMYDLETNEADDLKDQANAIKAEMQKIESRLAELEEKQ